MPAPDASNPKFEGQDRGSLVYLASHPPVPPPPPDDVNVHADVRAAHTSDVWAVLVGFRIFNALAITTFFQPDEFYQSLEPAWQLAFGQDSGAWITWVSMVLFLLHSFYISVVARTNNTTWK